MLFAHAFRIIDVNLRDPQIEAAGDLIVDSSVDSCKIISADLSISLLTHDYDLITELDIRNSTYVYHALIHADIADYRALDAAAEHADLTAVQTAVSVCVAESDSRDLGLFVRGELASIAD